MEIVSDSVLLLPIGTDPKFRLPLPSTTVPVPFEPPARPLHPVSSHRPPVITRDMANRRSNREPFKATSVCRLGKPRRGFRATGAPKCQLRQYQCRSLVAASHRLRKGRMGLTSGQCALAQIPFSRCTAVRTKKSSQVIVNKWIKKHSRRDESYRGNIGGGFSWRTLRNSTATCMMILHIAHMPSS